MHQMGTECLYTGSINYCLQKLLFVSSFSPIIFLINIHGLIDKLLFSVVALLSVVFVVHFAPYLTGPNSMMLM